MFLSHGAVHVLVGVLIMAFLEDILGNHRLLKNDSGDKCGFV